MDRIVTIGCDLSPQGPSTRHGPLPLRPLGNIVENRRDDVETAAVSYGRKDERRISPQVSVFVAQPGFQLRKDAGIVDFNDFLGDFELLPKDSGTLELLKQLSSGLMLLPSTGVGHCGEKKDGKTDLGDYRSKSGHCVRPWRPNELICRPVSLLSKTGTNLTTRVANGGFACPELIGDN